MCGIAGIISNNISQNKATVDRMIKTIRHRGPDADGFYYDECCSLGHARLKIIDLSDDAKQPMFNESRNLILVFNGEIYNYLELRNILIKDGHIFKSKTDSEVIIHGYEKWGEDCVNHFNGMFAFAIWDKTERKLFCAVDRFGKKPFYYTLLNGNFYFASELKALMFIPGINKDFNPTAIDNYLTFRYVMAPDTMFKNIFKLEPANKLVYSWENKIIKCQKYWFPEINKNIKTVEDYVAEFKYLMDDAVKIRMQSDVPVGIYLSGGIDSSLIAAVIKKYNQNINYSYGVSFDYEYDEGPKSAKIAEYLGLQHAIIKVNEADFESLPEIIYSLDEPFGDLICLPAYKLARAAKQKITVVLTGDGADEIFNGYFHQKIMMRRNNLPAMLKHSFCGKSLAALIKILPVNLLNLLFDYPDSLGKSGKNKFINALTEFADFGKFYYALTSCYSSFDKNELYNSEFRSLLNNSINDNLNKDMQIFSDFSYSAQLSLLDLKYWIPYSVLFRLDKLNMASAVETRSPFLDYRMVEMALNLPEHLKFSRKKNKLILREYLSQLMPKKFISSGKQAFYAPFTAEYKKKLQLLVNQYLTKENVAKRNIFNYDTVSRIINMNFNSMLNNRQLISLLIFEIWCQIYIDNKFKFNEV